MEYSYAGLLLYTAGTEITRESLTATLESAGATPDRNRVATMVPELNERNLKEATQDADADVGPYIYAALLLEEVDTEITEGTVTRTLETAGVDVDEKRVQALLRELADVDMQQAVNSPPDGESQTDTPTSEPQPEQRTTGTASDPADTATANTTEAEILQEFQSMDEYEFEETIARLWERRGWETTVTSGSRDRGIDVIAKRHDPFEQKHIIQAKRYAEGNTIGSSEVRTYSTLKNQEERVDAVVIVTTSSFTAPAEKLAEELNVKLVDGEALCKMVADL